MKEFDEEKLDTYIKILRITIILCWATLFSYWLIKLLGGNWFKIAVTNKNFIKFSELLQNTWLKYLYSYFTIFIGNYLPICAVCQKFYFKGKDLAILIVVLTSIWAVANFIPNFLYMGFWYAYAVIIIYGIVYQKGKKKALGLLAVAFDFLFPTISMLVRDIQLRVITDYLMLSILVIDTFIMYALYYLYSNLIKLKGVSKNVIVR